ncbi:outer membrane lipoprotein carrier protein LolA [Solitalea longa]|uniref:Outer membrane lipoprotein carrier protein LolA n=1 Tax=Solitalea longa TaxID=2079460 RepID=A0A2S5A1S0_9SPHI|nr:outer membrane lipoprotein carrier protein LolA [Solitalea longa]POY36550.1 outer membrane lipoprotein carrier protein LolA [Solitalea longa]
MRKLILAGMLMLSVLSGKAQYKLVTDLATFKVQFANAAKTTETIKSDFIQEKNLSVLEEKIVSKGKFWFKKDNLVRMEYTQPFKYLMVINKNNILIRDGQNENKISTKSNKMFQQINKIIVDCVQGTALNNPDFKFRVFENNQTYMLELTPVTKGLKDFFKNVNITVDKKDYSVGKLEMVEASGDNTIITFLNKELNQTIPNAVFAVN